MATDKRSRRGFTLIEVLVVVSIIALLVSILLPSLAQAREAARQAVCSAHIKQVLTAENQYQMQYHEWIPGSPFTTGLYFLKNAAPRWGLPSTPMQNGRYNRFSIQTYDWPTPLRAMMLGSGSITGPNDTTEDAAHRVRAKLFKESTEGVFHCPSNNQVATAYSGLGQPHDAYLAIQAVSYLTVDTMLRPGQLMYNELNQALSDRRNREWSGVSNRYGEPNKSYVKWITSLSAWEVGVPADYVPRHTKIGNASEKVYVLDGLRYIEEGSGMGVTYNTDFHAAKGAWGGSPPSTAEVEENVHNREYTYAKEFSFRHGQKDSVNAGFFDGHVEGLKVSGHRYPPEPAPVPNGLIGAKFTGDAVHPKHYYPKGSVINNPENLHHPNGGPLQAGMVLP